MKGNISQRVRECHLRPDCHSGSAKADVQLAHRGTNSTFSISLHCNSQSSRNSIFSGSYYLMPRALKVLRKLQSKIYPSRKSVAQPPAPSTPTTTILPRHHRDHSRFAQGDRVFAIHGFKARLLPALHADAETQFDHGVLRHNDIIGQPLERLKVTTSKGKIVTVAYPTLDDYISKSSRLVQPIYAPYASTIVDLLDIHVSPPGLTSQRVEVLDAGTGHGSLALHLAKSIAAANPPPPDLPKPDLVESKRSAEPASAVGQVKTNFSSAWTEYRSRRKAVVHSVESVAANSLHAEKTIRGFRQGLYWPHIDFSTARVEEWARQQHADRGAFLSYATLDLPDVHEVITAVSEALMVDGKLAVFTPSITQIAECQRVILEKNLSLHFVKVVELGEGISTGRVWDLRSVTPRARERTQAEPAGSTSNAENPDENDTSNIVEDSGAIPTDHASTGKVLICRPKVGDRVVGGGFVGLFRKTSTSGTEASGVKQNVQSERDDPNQPGTTPVAGHTLKSEKHEALISPDPAKVPAQGIRHEANSKEMSTADPMPDQRSDSLSASTALAGGDDIPLISVKQLLDAVFELDAISFTHLVMAAVGHRKNLEEEVLRYLNERRRRILARHYRLGPVNTLFAARRPFPYPGLKQVSLKVESAAFKTEGLAVDLALIILVRSLKLLQAARDGQNAESKEKLGLNDKMIAIQHYAWLKFNTSRLGTQPYTAQKISRSIDSTLQELLTFPSIEDFNAYWGDITILTASEQATTNDYKVESTARKLYQRQLVRSIGDSTDKTSKDLQNPADPSSAPDSTISGAQSVEPNTVEGSCSRDAAQAAAGYFWREVKLDIENGARRVKFDNFIGARRVHLETIGGTRPLKLDAIERSDSGDETEQPLSFWTTLSEAPPLDLTPRSEKQEGNVGEAQEEKPGPHG